MKPAPYPVIFGIATLGHQFGYVNILPLYTVLMLAAPFAVRLGQLAPLRLLAGSVTLWAVTALWQVSTTLPQSGGWLFNPFAWQLVFTLGIVTGLALRRTARRSCRPGLVKRWRWLGSSSAASGSGIRR